MDLERRLRMHFDAAGNELAEPATDVSAVVARGRRRRIAQRAAVAASTTAVAAVAVLGLQGLAATNVEFKPAPPAAQPSAKPPPSDEPSPGPNEAVPPSRPAPLPSEAAGEEGVVDVSRLPGPVLTYGPGGVGLGIASGGDHTQRWPEPVVLAFADGRGGVVLQERSGSVVWLPDGDAGSAVRRDDIVDDRAEGETEITLRGVEADGSVVFSSRPAKRYSEDIVERFFTVPLVGGGAPELIGTEGAFEAHHVGPAQRAHARRVLASCHMFCSIYAFPDQDDTFPFPDAIYEGGGGGGPQAAIEGLTSTAAGTLVAFVEASYMAGYEDDGGASAPELVVVDAATFDERLRLPLPVAPSTSLGEAAVSLSGNGQQILVSIDPPRTGSTPRTTFFIDDALRADPSVQRVDFPGVVRWLNP